MADRVHLVGGSMRLLLHHRPARLAIVRAITADADVMMVERIAEQWDALYGSDDTAAALAATEAIEAFPDVREHNERVIVAIDLCRKSQGTMH